MNLLPCRSCRRSASGRRATSILEVLTVLSVLVLITSTFYGILRSVRVSFTKARNRLDILQATRLIMAGVRNELRSAINKPEVKEGKLFIPVYDKLTGAERTIVYYFDDKKRLLFRGEADPAQASNLGESDMRCFTYADGQILKFEYDNSYRDANAFAASELMLHSKVWVKVSMKVLFTEKYNTLSEADKQKIIDDPNDPRVKSFFMMITPRKVNWLLQGTE